MIGNFGQTTEPKLSTIEYLKLTISQQIKWATDQLDTTDPRISFAEYLRGYESALKSISKIIEREEARTLNDCK